MKVNEIQEQFDQPIFATIRTELYQNVDAVTLLLQRAGVSLPELLALDFAIRAELYQNTDAVIRLLQEVGVSLAELAALDSAIRAELYNNSFEVMQLFLWAGVRLVELAALDPAIRSELYKNAAAVIPLLKKIGVTLAELVALDPAIRAELYQNFAEIDLLPLSGRRELFFQALFTLTSAIRAELYANSYPILQLFKKTGVSLAELLALDSAIRAELYQNTDAVIQLLLSAGVSLAELAVLDAEIRAALYQNAVAVTRLLNEVRQSYQYLITNKIITGTQLIVSLLDPNPYLIIQNFVNQTLTASGTLPQGRQLNATNIADLIQLLKGVAEIRKNARVLSQRTTLSTNIHSHFHAIPEDIRQKIAGLTGNDHEDETGIATVNYGKPTG